MLLAELSPAKRAVLEARLKGLIRPSGISSRRLREAYASFAQERLWFVDRLEPGSPAYNVPAAVRLEGPLAVPTLERALGEIVRRHETLRTTLAERDGVPVQVIAPYDGFTLEVEDLSGLGAVASDAARQRAREEAARPFDLTAGPLLRVRLLRLGEQEHVLLVNLHHMVTDGWSQGIFFRELAALYAAYQEGRESPLPELPVQYADYAVWQRAQLHGTALERAARVLARAAAGRAGAAGAADRSSAAAGGRRIAGRRCRSRCRRRCARGWRRSHGATARRCSWCCSAAFQVLLARYSGSDDVVVGSPIAGRTRREVEELIGFFVNTLVLRTDLSGDPTFREVLRRVREVTLGAFEHQDMPFEQLVADLQPERSLSHAPLFQVLFTLRDAEGARPALPGLRSHPFGAGVETTKFDLMLGMTTHAHGLRALLTYSTDLFEPATVERMLGHLVRVLEQVATDPDARLDALTLLADAERAQVVEGWNQTDRKYPGSASVPEVLARHVTRTPDAVAVVCGDQAVSYGALDARASRLAHVLLREGVRPGRRWRSAWSAGSTWWWRSWQC